MKPATRTDGYIDPRLFLQQTTNAHSDSMLPFLAGVTETAFKHSMLYAIIEHAYGLWQLEIPGFHAHLLV